MNAKKGSTNHTFGHTNAVCSECYFKHLYKNYTEREREKNTNGLISFFSLKIFYQWWRRTRTTRRRAEVEEKEEVEIDNSQTDIAYLRALGL